MQNNGCNVKSNGWFQEHCYAKHILGYKEDMPFFFFSLFKIWESPGFKSHVEKKKWESKNELKKSKISLSHSFLSCLPKFRTLYFGPAPRNREKGNLTMSIVIPMNN